MALFEREYIMKLFEKIFKHKYTTAIIVAAGSGTRMNSKEAKQIMEIDGIPVIARTALAFEKADTIDEIVVVTTEDLISEIAEILNKYSISKVTKIVLGGSTRQLSVLSGMEAVSKRTKYIAIQDAARPFITAELIDKVNITAYEADGAAPAIPVTSTVKVVDENGFISKTIDRSNLRLVQTPQTFNLNKYKILLYKALALKKDYTDDCQLFEAEGGKIKLIEGDLNNIKITYKEDIVHANAIAISISEEKNENRNRV